jgi:hypothetical protein
MRRDQLEHAIRTACQIIGNPEVIIVGSQSILGTFREDQLPADATMSVEICPGRLKGRQAFLQPAGHWFEHATSSRSSHQAIAAVSDAAAMKVR